MKKILLAICIGATGLSMAQNIDDQKIAFNYTQLPSDPIKGPKVYNVLIDHSKYQQSNEDSLAAFEAKMSLAESQLVTWIEQKKKIDQAYLLEMDSWQKTVDAGTPSAQPVKQPYPEMPMLKEELPAPILTEDISEGTVNTTIALEGFSKGEGGATITIVFEGLQNASFVSAKTGTGATTKYTYNAKYKMPVSFKLEVPGQGILINENLNQTEKSVKVQDFTSDYSFQYWEKDNAENYWKTIQSNELSSVLSQINNIINDRCGFPVKSYATEIYTVKKHKGQNYSDLINAYTQAKAGYDLIYQDLSKSAAKAKLTKAISTWEKALQESDVNDNKARINDKVTALLYVNIAEAYIWMDEYIKADGYIQKAKIMSVAAGKYRREAEDLEQLSAALKARKLAND